jgi:hypothetical protein
MNDYKPYLLEFVGTFVFMAVILKVGTPLAVGAALALVCFLNPTTLGGYNPLVLGMNVVKGVVSNQQALIYLLVQVLAAGVALQYVAKVPVLPSM